MEKKELKKYSVKTKFFRAITYGVLVLLALICIVPFYNMIINCTHDNAALATSFQMTPGKSLKLPAPGCQCKYMEGAVQQPVYLPCQHGDYGLRGRADSLRLCQV